MKSNGFANAAKKINKRNPKLLNQLIVLTYDFLNQLIIESDLKIVLKANAR